MREPRRGYSACSASRTLVASTLAFSNSAMSLSSCVTASPSCFTSLSAFVMKARSSSRSVHRGGQLLEFLQIYRKILEMSKNFRSFPRISLQISKKILAPEAPRSLTDLPVHTQSSGGGIKAVCCSLLTCSFWFTVGFSPEQAKA